MLGIIMVILAADKLKGTSHPEFLVCPYSPVAISSSIERLYVLSNPFPSKPSIVFSLKNHSTVSLLGIFVVQIWNNLVNIIPRCKQKNKGVVEMAPSIHANIVLINHNVKAILKKSHINSKERMAGDFNALT